MEKKEHLKDRLTQWDIRSKIVRPVLHLLHRLLKLLVRFFWLPILFVIIYQIYFYWGLDGISTGIFRGLITLLIGIGIWAFLYLALIVVNIGVSISQVVSQVNDLQQNMPQQQQQYFYPLYDSREEGRVVEGSITDLEQERRKRRQAQE